MITLREIYQALSALDCAVTRGWPQAMIPLPAIAFSGCEDSVGEDGSRRFQVLVTGLGHPGRYEKLLLRELS